MSGRGGTDVRLDDIWHAHRPYLVDLGFRMLGQIQDAEDAVQEAFTRLLHVDIDEIDDIRGWLVVVVSRICLDQLRSAKTRRESYAGSLDDERAPASLPSGEDPADRVTLDDSVRLALLVVLEDLSPPERAVFVLHDVFGFTFDAVASIVGRTPAACRQIAGRARRRIESRTGPTRFQPDVGENDRVAREFIAACAGSDIEALMRLLDANVVGEVDRGPDMLARGPFRGRDRVGPNLLTFFGANSGVTLVSQPVNGGAGVLAFRGSRLTAILVFKTRDGVIDDIHAILDPHKLAFASSRLSSLT
jgi:RNA polymerase sigma-70 factor (ECF subfamily)